MEDFRELVDSLSLDESKRLLLGLAQDIFSILGEDEKKDFIMKMIGQTGYDKVGSMVQL